ncbi:MAG TPA: hypothetical protein VFI25_03835 [Planctomycetota bacterium]|jgi:hypothetical protein|nr:hypothetical protein [Planctomycetota bacterium]
MRSPNAPFPSFLLVVSSLVFTGRLQAQVPPPNLLHLQARIADAGGTPLQGPVAVVVRVYDVALGGVPLWEEGQTSTALNGIVNLVLGSVTPLPASLFDGTTRYLAFQVGSDPEMIPRRQIVAVPYALRAAKAEGLDLGSVLFVSPSGNVGIGTTTPLAPLEVAAPLPEIRLRDSDGTGGGASAEFQFRGSDNSLRGFIGLDSTSFEIVNNLGGPMSFDTSGLVRMLISATGNVGIGTTNPDTRLTVAAGDIMLDNDHGVAGRRALGGSDLFVGSNPSNQMQIGDGWIDMLFKTFNTEKMRITSSGNVGIGTTSPGATLDVAGSTRTLGFAMPTGASNGYVLTSDAAGAGSWQLLPPSIGGTGTANAIPRFTGTMQMGDSVMTQGLSSWGSSVGVGTASPQAKLHVSQGPMKLDNAYTLISDNSTGGSGTLIGASADAVLVGVGSGWGDLRLFGGPTEAVRITNGNVGIGTATPGYRLHVDGSTASFNGPTSSFVAAAYAGNGVFASTYLNSWPAVYGTSSSSNGVFGTSSAPGFPGVFGSSSAGGAGVTGAGNPGVYGFGSPGNPGVVGVAGGAGGYGVFSSGDYGGTGAKYFVQPHPTDPSREIRFVCLEGNESGTYFRGSSRLVNGRAEIEVPEEFRLVTERQGLTVQLTPVGAPAILWVERKDLGWIVVRGNADGEFDYFVNGVRRGFAGHQAIHENKGFVPEFRGVPYGTQYPEALRRILVENGTLNPDFTPNEETARRLGRTLQDPEGETWGPEGDRGAGRRAGAIK